MERVLLIQGQTVITSSFLEEPVFITGIDLKDAEYAGPNFQMFEVKPGTTIRQSLLLNFRGVKPAKGEAFKANLTFVDIKGKRYPLKPALLRAFPGEDLPQTEPPKPKTDHQYGLALQFVVLGSGRQREGRPHCFRGDDAVH